MITYRAGDGRFVNRVDLGPVPVEAYGPALDPAKVEIQHRLAAGLGELSLVGFELDRDRTGPGGSVVLSLLWQATGRPQTDYQLRVELGETSIFQLAENYPTSRWPAETVLRSQHRLFVPAATRPGEVELRVGLLDAGGASVGMPVSLAFLRVEDYTRRFDLPAVAPYSRRAGFGDWATLLGYDLQPDAARDCTLDAGALEEAAVPTLSVRQSDGKRCVLHLTLYWQAVAKVGASYTVFTHLLDPEDRVYAQHDGLPGGGEWPTTGWVPGQVIVDRHDLALETGAEPGAYSLEVGLYDATSGMRVPAADEQGRRQLDDRVVLAILEMK
jgi:hypothetical protein